MQTRTEEGGRKGEGGMEERERQTEEGQKDRRKRGGETACYSMFNHKIIHMNQNQVQIKTMVIGSESDQSILSHKRKLHKKGSYYVPLISTC